MTDVILFVVGAVLGSATVRLVIWAERRRSDRHAAAVKLMYEGYIEQLRDDLKRSNDKILELIHLNDDRVRLEVGLPAKADLLPPEISKQVLLPDEVYRYLEGFADVNDRADFEMTAIEFWQRYPEQSKPTAEQVVAYIGGRAGDGDEG